MDDFANYAVEQDLMIKLESIFAPSSIFGLDESTIENIAGETEESKIEREQSTKKMAALQLALQVLERLDQRNTVGRFSFPSLLSVSTVAEVIRLTCNSRCGDVLRNTDKEVETEDSTDESIVETSTQIPVGALQETLDDNKSESVETSSDTTADDPDEHPRPPSTLLTISHLHMQPFDLKHPLISPRVKQVLSQVELLYPYHVSRTVQSIVTVRFNFEKMDVQQRLAYTERYRLEAESPGMDDLYYLRMNCIVHCMRSGEWA